MVAGMKKFTGDDSTRIWDHLNEVTAWAQTEMGKLEPKAWTAYTPTWTDGTNPLAVKSGSLSGEFEKIGRHCKGQIVLQRAADTNLGTGLYVFGLPPSAIPRVWDRVGGSGTITGNGKNLPITVLGTGNGTIGIMGPAGRIGGSYPGNWGAEKIVINFDYETQ